MRKEQKKRIEELMLTIHNAQQEFCKLVKRGQYDVALGVLMDCQEGAISIGTSIEQSEEDSRVVGLLEDYCECLYEASLAVENQENIKDVYQRLRNKSEDIMEAIHTEVQEQYEIVFLPYKASMWDSLESVWAAVAADPRCTAYVIPIPYFDRHSDGSMGDIHYEGDLYPSYVPITSWREYDLEKKRPDVIYIHNPYDGCNLVTSVHPYFYAEKLKEYTDMLVYVPYFACIEDVQEDLCDTPGVFFADRVILESDRVRDTYMKTMRNLEEIHKSKGMFGDLKSKFLVLGSPKYDKVLNTRRENVELPKEWIKIMTRGDGTRKKVVFYNTTITTLLRYNEKTLEKIKYVLDVFKRNKDVALLWRPHPLNEATVASMRPGLLESYHEIVGIYREEGWGIFDDTPDLHRAIALSDAYYGDWSSVVALYKVTGKPIMIENMDIVQDGRESHGH